MESGTALGEDGHEQAGMGVICAVVRGADGVRLPGGGALDHGAFDRTCRGRRSRLFRQPIYDRIGYVASQAVASVVGIGGTAGAVGGMLIAKNRGLSITADRELSGSVVFAGTAYLIALGSDGR